MVTTWPSCSQREAKRSGWFASPTLPLRPRPMLQLTRSVLHTVLCLRAIATLSQVQGSTSQGNTAWHVVSC